MFSISLIKCMSKVMYKGEVWAFFPAWSAV